MPLRHELQLHNELSVPQRLSSEVGHEQRRNYVGARSFPFRAFAGPPLFAEMRSLVLLGGSSLGVLAFSLATASFLAADTSPTVQ